MARLTVVDRIPRPTTTPTTTIRMERPMTNGKTKTDNYDLRNRIPTMQRVLERWPRMARTDRRRFGLPQLETINEVKGWINLFEEACVATAADGDMDRLIHVLDCSTIYLPGECQCDEVDLEHPALRWLHQDHGRFNWTCYCSVRDNGLIPALRERLEHEVAVGRAKMTDEEPNPICEGLLLHFAERLLEYFAIEGLDRHAPLFH